MTATKIVVAMPYFEAPLALAATIASIAREYTTPPQVVVCDDGSRLPARCDFAWVDVKRLAFKPHALNPCVPINAAVTRALEFGEVVALTNPGTVFRFGMLEHLAEFVVAEPLAYAFAACRDAETGRWLAHSTIRGGEFGRAPMPRGSGFHFLAVFRRELWDKAGGFDEAYRNGQGHEDNDFLWRLEAAGARFVAVDGVVVENRRSTTVWPLDGHSRNRALLEQKWGRRWASG